MAVDVLAYNARDGFGESSKSKDLVDFVEAQNPDIAFFSEAYSEYPARTSNPSLTQAIVNLERLGYNVTRGLYKDSDARLDRHGFIGLSRLGHGTKRRFETRNGFYSFSEDPDTGSHFNAFGIHLDDRNEHTRLAQIASLSPFVRETIFMGNLNTMHENDLVSRMARLSYPLVRHLPTIDPGVGGEKQPKLRRFGSLASRFAQMAIGDAMASLEHIPKMPLRDADPTHQPTIRMAGIPAQTDYIMVTDGITVDKFTVHDVSLSTHKPSHKPISATLSVR